MLTAVVTIDTQYTPFATVPQTPGPADIVVTNTPPEIQNGDTNRSLAEKTDFGTVAVGDGATREFVIENTGDGLLILSGTPPVQLNGAGSTDFTVLSQPETTIPPRGTLEFTVRFTPATTGMRTATVTITTNDADEGSFQFAVGGVGVAPARR